MINTHLNLPVARNWRTNARSLGTFHKKFCFVNRGALNRKALPLPFSLYRGFSVSIVPTVLLIRSYLHSALSRRTNCTKPGNLEKSGWILLKSAVTFCSPSTSVFPC
jgi:hypothetical protein